MRAVSLWSKLAFWWGTISEENSKDGAKVRPAAADEPIIIQSVKCDFDRIYQELIRLPGASISACWPGWRRVVALISSITAGPTSRQPGESRARSYTGVSTQPVRASK